MTIRETYSKFSTEELETEMKVLENKMNYWNDCMEDCKKNNDLEMYMSAKNNQDEVFNVLLDVSAAYIGRKKSCIS